jgi:hypothetical protein
VTKVDLLHEYYDRHCPWYKSQLWHTLLDFLWGILVTVIDSLYEYYVGHFSMEYTCDNVCSLCEYYVGHCSMEYTCDNGWLIIWILCWTLYYEVYLCQWLYHYMNIMLDIVLWGILVTMVDSLYEHYVGHCSMEYTCDNGWFIIWTLCWTL